MCVVITVLSTQRHQQVHRVSVLILHPREIRVCRTIFVVTDCETEKTQNNRKLINVKQAKCQQRLYVCIVLSHLPFFVGLRPQFPLYGNTD